VINGSRRVNISPFALYICFVLKNPKILQRFCGYSFYKSSREVTRPLGETKGLKGLVACTKCNYDSYDSEFGS